MILQIPNKSVVVVDLGCNLGVATDCTRACGVGPEDDLIYGRLVSDVLDHVDAVKLRDKLNSRYQRILSTTEDPFSIRMAEVTVEL